MKGVNSKYNYLIALGGSFVLSAILMLILQTFTAQLASSILSIGITMVIIGLFRKLRKNEFPEKDERIKKLSMYGLGYSWITTFLVITIFFWFDYFGLVKITTQQYYNVVFMTMIISAVAFQKFLYRKGDVV